MFAACLKFAPRCCRFKGNRLSKPAEALQLWVVC
jgi:hypothetical protein